MMVPSLKPRHWLASNPFDSNQSTDCCLRIESIYAVRRRSARRAQYLLHFALLAKKRTVQQMQEISLVSFSGVFALRDGVSEEAFLPRLHAFFQHFIDMGFATGYRVMRREALDD